MIFTKKPIIVALEGIPGAGKTTIMQTLRNTYNNVSGIDQILPGDLPDKDITISKIMKSDQLKTIACGQSTADVVVLDRYYQSTLAYHWACDKVIAEHKFKIIQEWHDECKRKGHLVTPDYTFFIDIDSQISAQRKNKILSSESSSMWSRKDFLETMREYYKNLIDGDVENCIYIDGQATIKEILKIILDTINLNPKDKYEEE